MSQLKMHFSAARIAATPAPVVPAGFQLRSYRPNEDDEGYIRLMHSAGFTSWSVESIQRTRARALPEGLFFLVDERTGTLACTAVANRAGIPGYSDGGEFGWLATAPEFRGRGLSRVIHDAVVRRYRQEGYQNLYLLTDDFRLPALKLYLGKGWEPIVCDDDAQARWAAVRERLSEGQGE